ncbi:TetR/AcrR family transcriptional regulator C-terminal domain-containing protein [Lactiplantibacillus pentosus]|uniref:TetR/AcrR family transcriptional regulator C-terminal domain-containing protein n=1 Tax=Lactiplantibacillus pentosus TaxID=1589 RepID=UPI00207AC459|nr:TetR/AcrR family transcriptional regulator C-terminal domain-containing protein [Lactiplantibacillus pentosus]USJ88008.1 TetR/AcrR family transcriptional regulator C-terminal domain-containing protein [Lactiplantibacillus pentosus]
MKSYTEIRMCESLSQLIEKKSFNDITVKDIVKASQVNRQTFYYHFEDKYDCLRAYLDNQSQEIIGDVTTENWSECYLHIFRYIDTHPTFFYHIDESSASSLFNDFVLEAIVIILKKLILSLKGNCSDYIFDKKPNIQVLKYGMQGIVLSWFRGGMRENPEFLVKDIAEIDRETLMHMLGGTKSENVSSHKPQSV